MKKIGAFIAIAGGLSLLTTSCNNQSSEMKVTEDGLMYRMIEDKPGDVHPQTGDYLQFHAKIKIGDSVVTNSHEVGDGSPFPYVMNEVPYKAYFTYGFKLLTEGDSAIFYTPVDTLRTYQQFDSWVKDTDTVIYEIRLVSIQSKADFEADQKRKMDSMKHVMDSMNAIQIGDDDKSLQDYFSKNNIKPKKTASGVYYTIQKAGSGDNIKPGQFASVKYTGMLMDGTKFDSNVDPSFGHTDPFQLVVGQGQVIRGWDDGLQMLKKGTKARLFIPSALGYGAMGSGDRIPPNSNLIFDVEILDVTTPPSN